MNLYTRIISLPNCWFYHIVFAFCVVVFFYYTCLVTITINDKSCLKCICSYVPCRTLLAACWVISLSLSSHSLAIRVHVTINVAPQKKLYKTTGKTFQMPQMIIKKKKGTSFYQQNCWTRQQNKWIQQCINDYQQNK
jgi:hypothetical protein